MRYSLIYNYAQFKMNIKTIFQLIIHTKNDKKNYLTAPLRFRFCNWPFKCRLPRLIMLETVTKEILSSLSFLENVFVFVVACFFFSVVFAKLFCVRFCMFGWIQKFASLQGYRVFFSMTRKCFFLYLKCNIFCSNFNLYRMLHGYIVMQGCLFGILDGDGEGFQTPTVSWKLDKPVPSVIRS